MVGLLCPKRMQGSLRGDYLGALWDSFWRSWFFVWCKWRYAVTDLIVNGGRMLMLLSICPVLKGFWECWVVYSYRQNLCHYVIDVVPHSFHHLFLFLFPFFFFFGVFPLFSLPSEILVLVRYATCKDKWNPDFAGRNCIKIHRDEFELTEWFTFYSFTWMLSECMLILAR